MNTSVKLNSGYDMPILGLGTYLSDKKDTENAVYWAIKCGYRSIDTASCYISFERFVFNNEEEVGKGIKRSLEEGLVKREELFITTKLWISDWEPERAEKSIRLSLKRLQLEYLDLFLIHFPTFLSLPEEERKKETEDSMVIAYFPPDDARYRLGYDLENMKKTWSMMESFQKKGYTRSIGVSNFSTKKLADLLEFCTIPPAMDQIELHPHLQQWNTLAFCKKHGIALTAYFPLGGSKQVNPAGSLPLMEDAVIVRIAESHHKTPAQVLIRWCLQRGVVCIPKSITESRIVSNYDVFDFTLSEEDMAAIKELDQGKRISQGGFSVASPLTWKVVWDGEYVNCDCLLVILLNCSYIHNIVIYKS